MNTSNYRFTLDLHSTQSQISIPAIVGDQSRKLCIALSDGGKPYYIEDGCLAKISIKRPTGTYLVEFCNIERNTTIVYDFAQNANTAAVEGIHECDVTLYGVDDRVLGTPRFTMVVSERVIRSDDIVLTDEDRSEIDAILAEEARRQVSENQRISAENLRISAEKTRVSSEESRATAEGSRASAEEARVIAETARESNESTRKSNEVSRQETFNQMRADIIANAPRIQDGYWYIGNVNTNVKAKGEDGAQGVPGADGADGLTPYIGKNGNWWLGNTDTGVNATPGVSIIDDGSGNVTIRMNNEEIALKDDGEGNVILEVA